MTEQERREEEILKNCIQEAYGCSDEQLLAELEEIEASLSDDEFPGVEERMFERLMSRVEMEDIETCEVSELKDIDAEKTKVVDIKKLPNVRIKKRKVLIIGILAATFMTILGGTAIGDRNYLLRERKNTKGMFYNENNLISTGDMFSAYDNIKQNFGGQCLMLNAWPEGMIFKSASSSVINETLIFEYKENYIYFVQIKKDKISSINVESDNNQNESVENKWLNKELEYSVNILENNDIEYESKGLVGEISYWLYGKMEQDEFENILKNINYY